MTTYSEADIAQIKQEAKDEAKNEFKEMFKVVTGPSASSANSVFCKQPSKFVSGRDDIARYIDRWDAYRRVVGVRDPEITRIFFTFLDNVAIDKLLDNLNSAEKDDWAAARPRIVELLEPAYLPFQAKAKLNRARQKPSESIENYISRLTDLGKHAYKDSEQETRDRLVLDAFLSGLKSRDMAIMLFSKLGPKMKLADALAEAKVLEIAVKSRIIANSDFDEATESMDEEGQVLAISAGPSNSAYYGDYCVDEQNDCRRGRVDEESDSSYDD